MKKVIYAVSVLTFTANLSLADCVDDSGIERTDVFEPAGLGGCSFYYPSFEIGYEIASGYNIGSSLMLPFSERRVRHGTFFKSIELGFNIGDMGLSSRIGYQNNSFIMLSSAGFGLGLLNEVDWVGKWSTGYYVDAHLLFGNIRLLHTLIPKSELNLSLGLRL